MEMNVMSSDNKEAKKGFKWKPILAVFLVLGILGILLSTGIGGSLFGNVGGGVGGLTGGIVGIFQPKVNTGGFDITLSASRDSFYGQDFKVTNASVFMNGVYSVLTIGDQNIDSTSGKNISVTVMDFTGDVQLTNAGSVSLTGTSDYVMIGDLVSSSAKSVKIQMEVIPDSATIGDLSLKSIQLDSALGTLSRTKSGATDTVSLAGTKVDISDFIGSLALTQNDATLTGASTSVKGDSFTLS